jgi:3-deoxy-D-manno-octulosonic-acid transferase
MNRYVYTCLLYLLLPFTPLKLLWRARTQPEYLLHWRERYGFYRLKIQMPVIWLHCVSVGETRAAAPLIQALSHHYPRHRILLTHTTPTGRATSEQLFGDHIDRVYLPYDIPYAVNRFLNHFKPVIGVLVETELWFNLLASCKQRQIPLLLVNARLSAKSAQGYAKLGSVAQIGLQSLVAIGAQTEQDAERLRSLGAGNAGNLISVVGNIKFDVVPPDEALAQGEQLRQQLGAQRPILLAASTRDGEEAMIIAAVTAANIKDLLTVIVPRHPQRFDAVAALLQQSAHSYVRRSSLITIDLKPQDEATVAAHSALNVSSKPVAVHADVAFVLGDSMGEMFSYYAACDVAFIGGSLLPLGGQNLIEACAMGKPVLIGPYTFNFEQATDFAISAGAAQRVQDTADLAATIQALFADADKQQRMAKAALHFSQYSRGATLRTLVIIAAFIQE